MRHSTRHPCEISYPNCVAQITFFYLCYFLRCDKTSIVVNKAIQFARPPVASIIILYALSESTVVLSCRVGTCRITH